MKGLEKLTCIRLAEVLTQRGTVETDAITDALYAQDRQGEVFVDVLVSNGHISEWDLAKIVVEHFQLPFISAGSTEIPDDAMAAFPKEFLFQHRIVPLGVFEQTATIVLPILTPYEVLVRLQEASKLELFPYVGLISENVRVLGEIYPEYPDWAKQAQARREAESRKNRAPGSGSGDWMDMFDSADASVRDGLG
ncbi:MAG: hypothetical protein KDB80_07195 [Planctomycetes bacterium]|nr:hypothetical protein [Planctomycetota bacterium]